MARSISDDSVLALLEAAQSGDDAAFQRLYARLYDELRRLARRVRAGRGAETLNTTALVHEAFLKLAPGHGLAVRDRTHFLRIAARAMRQVLVDAARRRQTRARALVLLAPDADAGASAADGALAADVLVLEEALRSLESISPRQASVVECRFFAGLSVEDTAIALAVSEPTIKRDWRVARAWLAHAMGEGADGPPDDGVLPARLP